MNTHETYKGYTLRVENDNGGFNGRVYKNSILVFDTWRPTEGLAQADMKKWVDREVSPMIVRPVHGKG